ncbi:MAG: malto-oligosyltrehalose synthase [Sphingobium sp.]
MMTPRATYRLQLHADFTFADAERIVPYLAALGISHVYASPITVAAKGSMHGYDVIDPTRINPELGGEAGLRSFVAAIRAEGLGLIIDIVPNHMGVAGDENRWWMDVLAKGEASEHAATFDIDWSQPVALPVLGAPLDEVIAAGDLRLVEHEGGFGLKLYDGAVYPVRAEDVTGTGALHDLVGRQHYRPIYWRSANDTLNWRRFFSINELAGVRVEDEAVFARTHQLYYDLFRDGLIDGVRVDHVDGLTDPAAYCRRLRAGFEAIAPDRPAYIVIEKILAADEHLATDWDVDGTSGYDFMREVSELIHDPAGQPPLTALWREISGRSGDFTQEAFEGRRDLLAWQFEGQLVACVDAFVLLARSAGKDWLTAGMLRRAMERLLWLFPVYRTYGTGKDAPAADAAIRKAVGKVATRIAPPGEAPVIAAILGWLAGEGGGSPDLAAEAVRRFQQLSAPIAAKGVEDTAFYRHGVLLSANDVGFEPAHIGRSVETFHAAMLSRGRDFPGAMLASATHDHKRGEDARARLAVLSAIPDLWADHALRWLAAIEPEAAGVDPADAYLLLQALVGAWEGPCDALLPRILDLQRKALREAKLRSSWEAPDEDYEERCGALATALLTGEGQSAFRAEFQAFIDAIAAATEANALAQTMIRYAVPGVPDLYQGCELADYSMVDPDNRRPVDYAERARLLTAGAPPKLRLIADLLALRAEQPLLFAQGDYRPVAATGERANHIVAFTRTYEGRTLLCAAAVRLGEVLFDREALPGDWWGETRIGARVARDVFGGGVTYVGWLDSTI